MRRSLFFLLLSFFLLAGCVQKTVKEAAEERLSKIKVGETTKTETSSILGTPPQTFLFGGEEFWQYPSYRVNVNGEIESAYGQYWPDTSDSEALTIHFGKNDVIKAMGVASQFGKAQQK